MSKTTLLKMIETMSDGQEIGAVIFGRMGWNTGNSLWAAEDFSDDNNSDLVPNYTAMPKGKILSLDEAMPWLSFEFNNDNGSPECQSMIIYTKDWIITLRETDQGHVYPFRLPRNPIDDFFPEMR